MKAVRVHGPDDVRLDEIDTPVAGPKDVIVRVATAGICGSDVTYVHAGGVAAPTIDPFGLGHELSGTVSEVGADVTGISAGDRVIVNPMGDGNGIGNGVPEGAFAPYLLVRNATVGGAIHKIPDTMAFDRAALAEPLSVGLHAVNRSGAKPGDKVVLFGAGPIGLGILLFLKQRGLTDIAVVDMTEQRLERARQLGATVTINPTNEDVEAALGKAFGAGDVFGWPVVNANLWFEVTGAAPVLQSIVRMAPFHATMLVVAVHHEPVPVNFQMALGKEMSIITSMAYPDEFPDVIATLNDPAIDVAPMISHSFPLDDFMTAFAVAQDKDASAKVLVTFDD
ncbi:zinc-dependent alcohol dehydrogenase [Sphingomonas sp. KC8]|uniref:zinc-dependent alcohol dehydrogenase n=1 Tax=Sphingomonas sp. KC8 TaxID=1030157 RepID=UPI000301974E|nr:zinc-binding dehydrogenase [Sphingomonas sp. KC8]ARS28483.1 alcohol dehydrogenase [Sphingomonas sp. KC8]